MNDFFHLKSINELHKMFDFDKPSHPLITIVREWPQTDFDFENIKMSSDLYVIGMKGNPSGSFKYGHNSYDYNEGTMVFLSPNQVAKFDQEQSDHPEYGWTIFFHPDLIRKSSLGSSINQYTFFNYKINEALHTSEKEKEMLCHLVEKIEIELQKIDTHSQELIIINLESILKYCNRYYDRQFHTRTNMNKGYVSKFENYLDDYFHSENLTKNGMPSLSECGIALNMSGSYLSDLLKAETGKSAKDHIYSYMIDKAKTLLLSSSYTVSEIAYKLGFNYPQHFSKLFKSKIGKSPTEFRNLN